MLEWQGAARARERALDEVRGWDDAGYARRAAGTEEVYAEKLKVVCDL